MNILEMREIYKAFPGVVALDHVTLELEIQHAPREPVRVL